jgi:LemA protein
MVVAVDWERDTVFSNAETLHKLSRLLPLENTNMSFIILVGLVLATCGVVAYVVTIYNGLVALRNDIEKAWSNIDIMLKQRHDELSKLLDVCKGYTDFEAGTLFKITQARSQYQQAVTVDQKAQADQGMTSALKGFFAVAENYPDLKANAQFVTLQKRISELESQIADRREFYNDSVNTFNVRIQQMPDAIVAGYMDLKPHALFQVEAADKSDVPMSFGAAAR